MSISISVSRLKENLMASCETEDFPHPQNLLKHSSNGLKYLYEKVFLNVLIDKKQRTNHFDYDAFDMEDIYDLYEFCEENCTKINSKELASLWKIYSDCRYSEPSPKTVSFI